MSDSAFDKLSKLKVGALFMETGTGKTKIALDLMAYKLHKVDYMLWICPCSLKGEIENERMKWHPELTFDVVGCETLGSSDKTYLETLDKVKSHHTFVVVDESLKIKNVSAKRTRRIIQIGDNAEYKLILNGTPISKNIGDMWAQMEFLSPKILNMNYHDFQNRYIEFVDIKIGTSNINKRTKTIPKGSKNVDNLMSLISPYVFESSLDIDSVKHYHDHYYHMTPEEHEEYDCLKESLFFDVDANGFKELRDNDFYTITTELQHFYTKCQDHTDRLNNVIDSIDEKVIVFVKYLSSIPNGALAITGDTKDRKGIIQRFRDDDENVLFVTYGCGAFGLNLQFCHNIIFAEHGFDYATRLQAEARIYRMGQTENVHYHDLICDIGLEKLFLKCIYKKSNLLDEVKNEIMKNGLKNL